MNKISTKEITNGEFHNKNIIPNNITSVQNIVQKQYGLALGGGSALGLSHIGVIKYLEENCIIIKEISGTSMGAIIASFYASGKTSDYMMEFAKSINFLKLIDFDLKNGLIKGDKIYKKLEEVFGEIRIEELDIKLKIVATNIETGEKTIFEKGKIIDAIRASISLPGIFKPYKIGTNIYIDGGIICNLPIEVLDLNNIIAVSVIKDVNGKLKTKKKIFGYEFDTGFVNLNYQVLQRSFLLMMKTNEQISINTDGKNVLLVKPDLGDMDFLSFDKLDELIKKGYEEASLVLGDI